MTKRSIEELAEAFFSAIERGDAQGARDCLTPDAVLWHNGTRRTMTRDENLKVLQGFIARSVSREYRDRRIDLLPDGFVQQHLVVARAADGHVLEFAACLVCRVADGRIVRIDEYFDWSDMPAWFERTQPQFERAGIDWTWDDDARGFGAYPTRGE